MTKPIKFRNNRKPFSSEELIHILNIVEPDSGKNRRSILKLFFDNSWQRFAFLAMCVCFCLTITFALLTYTPWQTHLFKTLALLSATLAQVFAVIYQVCYLVPDLLKLRNPTAELMTNVMKKAPLELQIISRLSDMHVLQRDYFIARLELANKHLNARMGMLIGAIEKVGLVPLSITWFFAFYKFKTDLHYYPSYSLGVAVALAFLCLLAIISSASSQKIERSLLLLKIASQREI